MPNSGYTSSAANAVYSPYCTGTPTIVAYARLCGTRSAHTDNPATASATSHFRSYRGSQPTIGRYFFSTRRSFVSATPWTAATATVTLASRSSSYHRMNRLGSFADASILPSRQFATTTNQRPSWST